MNYRFLSIKDVPVCAWPFYRYVRGLARRLPSLQRSAYVPACRIVLLYCMDGREADTIARFGLVHGPRITAIPFAGTRIDGLDTASLEKRIARLHQEAYFAGEDLLVLVGAHYSSDDPRVSCAAHGNDTSAAIRNAVKVAEWISRIFDTPWRGHHDVSGGRVIAVPFSSDTATEARRLLNARGEVLLDTNPQNGVLPSWEDFLGLLRNGFIQAYPYVKKMNVLSLGSACHDLATMFAQNAVQVAQVRDEPAVSQRKSEHKEGGLIIGNGCLIQAPNGYFHIDQDAPGLVGLPIAMAFLAARTLRGTPSDGMPQPINIFLNVQYLSDGEVEIAAHRVLSLEDVVRERLRMSLTPGSQERIRFNKLVDQILADAELSLQHHFPRAAIGWYRDLFNWLSFHASICGLDFMPRPLVRADSVPPRSGRGTVVPSSTKIEPVP